ncbi:MULTISPECIES: hypothetical protein [Enterobacteriaceae]|uniref:Uncharacterized protein n=1 Tax=Kluyvera cryocrescens TaxID=580 RepID=A0AAW9CBC7_KLUCR|nr:MULTISPECIES: hypothetical protein [Enterobacteriaceae]MDV2812576.1 hypothetical protein [Klebsiella pneumoniae]MDV2922670.1 hypothetical protein [Klebsiella pneumoniae]MDV2927806.1 hypothetical protein [Klebsiella pneumoniae]MDW3779646.1 hypothetical protein [Kluyvera cryocrescens]MEB7558793.1 hypothetical protein [Kluyvera cryocrescens]
MSDFERLTNLEKMTAVGKLLYGRDSWQSPLSRALGVSDRTIRNYVSGETPVPVGISDRLLSLIEERISTMNAAKALIESDRIKNIDTADIKFITRLVDEYAYDRSDDRLAAIDAVNNSVCDGCYLSDLREIARKFAI